MLNEEENGRDRELFKSSREVGVEICVQASKLLMRGYEKVHCPS